MKYKHHPKIIFVSWLLAGLLIRAKVNPAVGRDGAQP